MKRNTALKIINPVLIVLFISQAITGLFHHQIVSASYKTWEILHEGGGKVFIGLVMLHLILNFNWIKANYFKTRKATQS